VTCSGPCSRHRISRDTKRVGYLEVLRLSDPGQSTLPLPDCGCISPYTYSQGFTHRVRWEDFCSFTSITIYLAPFRLFPCERTIQIPALYRSICSLKKVILMLPPLSLDISMLTWLIHPCQHLAAGQSLLSGDSVLVVRIFVISVLSFFL
jgi:hypothetical protein